MPDDGSRFGWPDVDEWVKQGLLGVTQAQAIRAYTAAQAASPAQAERPAEREAGLNLITIAYYFGAFLVLFAYTIFMGIQWESLGTVGQFFAALFSVLALWGIGGFLVKHSFPTAGSLLVFAGTGIVPLFIYTLERIAGIWPEKSPNSYSDFYYLIAPRWVYMELATIIVTLAVLYVLRFPMLVLLIAFWSWFLSMDLPRWMVHSKTWTWSDREQIIGAIMGLAMLAIGVCLQWRSKRDYSMWLYIFGHVIVLCDLGAITIRKGGSLGLLFLAVYLLFVVASVWLQRRVYLVAGAAGCYAYCSYLDAQVFHSALGFVFALASLGLVIILTAVAYQRFARPGLEQRFAQHRIVPVP